VTSPTLLPPQPERRSPLPWVLAAAGAATLLMTLVVVAAIAVPLFLKARDKVKEAEARRSPLRAPATIAGLSRAHDDLIDQRERLILDQLGKQRFPSALAAHYGSSTGDGLEVIAVRGRPLEVNRTFANAQGRQISSTFPDARPGVQVRRQGVILTCGDLAARAPRAWCTWADEASAGFTVGYGALTVERLADVTVALRAAVLG
jgi:hypothetical protein